MAFLSRYTSIDIKAITVPFYLQEMRQQLDSVLEQKIATPSMELYTPHTPTPSPSSRLIQAIIDLISVEDYSKQVSIHVHVVKQCSHLKGQEPEWSNQQN